MPSEIVQTSSSASGAVIHDMSPISMFMQADWVVQSIMIGLLLASFWGWAIIVDKFFRIKSIFANMEKFQDDLWSSDDLDKFYSRIEKREDHPIARIFITGMREWQKSRGVNLTDAAKGNTKERIAQVMHVAKNREIDEIESHLGFLASCGSIAPFVGLFGTVYGIMRSFIGIASAQNTSLTVVAPGIAEALFATAIGLFAAIPAVMFYNKYIGQVGRITGKMEDFITEFTILLSRQMDGHSIIKTAA